MTRRHNGLVRTGLLGACAVGGTLLAIVPSVARAGGSDVTCSAEWTDCLGIKNKITWVCPQNSQCCKTVFRDDGPDKKKNTDDDCTLSVNGRCEGTGENCTIIVWK